MSYYANEMEAITMRPPSTSIFGIDSDDRYSSYTQRRTNPTYPFRFNIQKNEAFLNGFFKRIALTEFRMNWTLPNISQAWGNNQMLMGVSVSGGATIIYTITLQDGFYGAEALGIELQRVMRTFPGMTQALVTLGTGGTDTTPDEFYWVRSGSPTSQFYFNPVPNSQYRQLIDMLNINQPTSTTLQTSLFSGIPTLRATDYIDIVCNQLTQNQNLRDASTSSSNRDVICRVYLDESTPSSATTITNNYSGVNGNVTLVAQITAATGSGNIATYTLDLSAGTYPVGTYCVISGIGGASSYNGSGRLLATTTTAPFTATVELTAPLSGTPTFAPAGTIALYDKLETVSIPQSTWDDRVNGVTPFVLYRQFITPKYIRWSGRMPIANMEFEMFDDMGRSIQDLWNIYLPSSSSGFNYANSFSWNATLLTSED